MLSWRAQVQLYCYLVLRKPKKQREFDFVSSSDEVNGGCETTEKGLEPSLEAKVNNCCKETMTLFFF